MKFSMFYIAEYSNMLTASALMATLFFGGWDIPLVHWDATQGLAWWQVLATLAAFCAKTSFFVLLYMWIRWTMPRFRYDQLMALGWKVMLPISLVYLTMLAAAIWYLKVRLGWTYGTNFALALGALNVVIFVVLVWWLDRGRIVSGTVARKAA